MLEDAKVKNFEVVAFEARKITAGQGGPKTYAILSEEQAAEQAANPETLKLLSEHRLRGLTSKGEH